MLRLRVKEIAEAQKLSMNMLSHRSEVSFNVIKECYRNPATDLLEDVSEEYMLAEMEERRKKK